MKKIKASIKNSYAQSSPATIIPMRKVFPQVT